MHHVIDFVSETGNWLLILDVIWMGIFRGQDAFSCVYLCVNCDELGIDSSYLVFLLRDEKESLRVCRNQDSGVRGGEDGLPSVFLSLLPPCFIYSHADARTHTSPCLSATLSTTLCR